MLTIYKHSDTGLQTLTEPVNGCWLNVVDPTPEEIDRLQALAVPTDYIHYSLDLDERSRSERENGDMLIILRIPFYQGEQEDIPYTSIPLGIILTEQYIVTVCKRQNDILAEFTNGRMRDLSTGKRYRFVLRILLVTANKYLSCLRAITKAVETLEDKLQLSIRNNEVLGLLKYQKSLTYFTTALKGNELVLERLDRSKLFNTYPDDEELLDDTLTENQQAIEMVNIQNNILSGMMDAFASIISNNLNEVIKLLTSVTLVLSFPSIIVGFFGMNVDLPFGGHPLASVIIFLGALGISLTVALFLKKRDWF